MFSALFFFRLPLRRRAGICDALAQFFQGREGGLTVKKIFILCTAIILCAAFAHSAADASDNISVSFSGKINHDTFQRGQSAACSISRFPVTLEEFKALQTQAAAEPQGAVVVLLAAMNIYKDDEALGKKCLELSMYRLYPSILDLMKRKLRDPESNGYSQHFIHMAYLKGASPENNYTPSKPYTVEVAVNSGRPYQKLTSANAQVIYLRIATKGADSPRPIEVIKPHGTNYFVVNNASSIISQVKFPVR